MALQIVEKAVSGVTVLDLVGQITLGSESSRFRTKFEEILAAGKTQIVLNLAGIIYVDSAGLGALVAAYTSAQNQGAALKLANLTARIREQLNITKLVTIFEAFNSVDDARKSFAKQA